ncbi:MAG: DivIVA domain-containing protein [Bacteroides sp.]|nr:DivIVA domain-containing protein [Eubacterium sp.]MCM1417335.1 DivIVA domain-containing protein [Roseburia sp.]MCM1461472.1 DivIVA domain-containing protein [Bacteroides sp.]
MDANSIKDRKFTEAMRGYKKEEVDDYLSDLAMEFSQLRNQNTELEKKLGVLADKIREYREDEDALKEALLGAQKQGNAVIANAKEKAAELIQEAQDKCDEMIAAAEQELADRHAEAEKTIADALAEKKRIEDEAAKRAADLHLEMEIQNELDREVLARTKREAEDFRTRLIVEYTNHMEMIKKIPEDCENEYVKDTTANHDVSRLRELLDRQNADAAVQIAAPAPETEREEDDSDIKVVGSFSEIPVSEAESTEVEEEPAEDGAFTVESAFGDEKDDESDAPDFLSSKPARAPGKSKYEKLEFGNNTAGNGKNKKRR